jgi:hypothetical protein
MKRIYVVKASAMAAASVKLSAHLKMAFSTRMIRKPESGSEDAGEERIFPLSSAAAHACAPSARMKSLPA